MTVGASICAVGAGAGSVATILVAASAAVISALALPVLAQPARESWPFIAASTVLQVGYYLLVARAYRGADMSQAYPLMRGTAPLIVALVSRFWLGEQLSLAATGGAMGKGTALLAVYALGLGIPFLLSAIFINRAIGVMNRIKPHLRLIERIMGALLVVVGAALLTGAFPMFAYWLLETFPWLASLG